MASIVFAGPLPPPVNGLSNANAATIAALAAAGHGVRTYDLSPRGVGGRLSHHLSRLRAAFAAAAGAMRRPTFHLAYMSVDGGLGLIYGLFFALLMRLMGKPLAAHHHSFAYIDASSRLMRLFLSLAPRDQLHVFLCGDMRSAFEARYQAALPDRYRGLVLPNAFMMPAVEQAEPWTGGNALVIGHLSNLSVDKGADLFLDLFETLAGRGVEISAWLAGPVEDATLEARIRAVQARHEQRFRYFGPLYGADKAAFFAGVDVFVFPTRYRNEAQPLVLLEALVNGCILATIARGCIACDHADSGGLVAADVASFAEVAADWVGALAAAPEQVRTLQAAARSHAEGQLRGALEARSNWLAALARLGLQAETDR